MAGSTRVPPSKHSVVQLREGGIGVRVPSRSKYTEGHRYDLWGAFKGWKIVGKRRASGFIGLPFSWVAVRFVLGIFYFSWPGLDSFSRGVAKCAQPLIRPLSPSAWTFGVTAPEPTAW